MGKENFLTTISLVGVLVPTKKLSDEGQECDFKLVTFRGVEYSILADSDWERVLENYRWEEVRVRGLLNVSTMTIIPQWVVPRGPTGEMPRVTNEPIRKGRDLVAKIKKTVVDLVLTPAFV